MMGKRRAEKTARILIQTYRTQVFSQTGLGNLGVLSLGDIDKGSKQKLQA